MKKLRVAYLYADGHAVLVYRKHDRHAGDIEWSEIHQQWTNARLDFTGRLVLGRAAGFLRLAKLARLITAKAMSIEAGSTASREKGIAIGSLAFTFSGEYYGEDSAVFHQLSCLSVGYTYQPDSTETWADICDGYRWGNLPVSKKFPLKHAQLLVAA